MPTNIGKQFEQEFKASVPPDYYLYRLKDDTSGFYGVSNPCDYILFRCAVTNFNNVPWHVSYTCYFSVVDFFDNLLICHCSSAAYPLPPVFELLILQIYIIIDILSRVLVLILLRFLLNYIKRKLSHSHKQDSLHPFNLKKPIMKKSTL